MYVVNADGIRMVEVSSDAEACRWWLSEGRHNDTLSSTGERMMDIVDGIITDTEWTFDKGGYVVIVDRTDQYEDEHASFDPAHRMNLVDGMCITCGWEPSFERADCLMPHDR